jgi:AMP nucleosidase
MIPEGVKTEESDKKVTTDYVNLHLKVGVEALQMLKNKGLTVKHLLFD